MELSLDPEFTDALERFGVAIPEEQAAQLQHYARLVWDWNERLNLTRHTTWDLFVGRDLVDSVHLANLLEPEEQVLDLGSGGGVPGIPLSILRPDVQVSLAESVQKKAKVLDDLVNQLSLPVSVYAARGEDLMEDFGFDTVTARGVGSLKKLITWLAPHFAEFQRLLVLKGPKWVEERGEARHFGLLKGLDLRKVDSYSMPSSENECVILEIRKST